MKNNLYAFYNKLSCRYGDVVAYPSDGYAVARVRELFSRNALPADEIELCYVGTIDIDTGEVMSLPPVRVPITKVTVDDLAVKAE